MSNYRVKRLVCCLTVLALVFCCFTVLPSTAKASADTGVFRQYLPAASGSDYWHFDRPQGLAKDQYGNIYVADTYNNRIQKFNSNGELITKWGSIGTGDGQFGTVYAIAVDKSGYVYVADSLYASLYGSDDDGIKDCRIQKFDSNGNFVKKWGSKGTGNGQFQLPQGIAVDSDGLVYISDSYNNNIQVFDSNGSFIKKWGSKGTGNGQFNSPCGIAIDNDGYIYIADKHNDRIQKFSANGKYIKKWGSSGHGGGKFDTPYGITVDNKGYVYVTDSENNLVQRFSDEGKFVKAWRGSGSKKLYQPKGIIADGFGYVYAADSDSVYKYETDGSFTAKWSVVSDTDGAFSDIEDIAFDSNDNLYVLDGNTAKIQKFNKNGKLIKKWSTNVTGEKRKMPISIAIDSDNKIYVIDDDTNPRVAVFNENGKFIDRWGKMGKGNGALNESARGMAFDKNGHLLIADTYNNLIQVFDKSGKFLYQWGGCKNNSSYQDGDLEAPRDIAIGPDGYIYVLDTYFSKISVFKDDGTFIRSFGEKGSGNGQLKDPFGIAFSKDGNLFVTEYIGDRVQEFDTKGNFIAKWGSKGDDFNQFKCPMDIEFDSKGNAFVADQANSRVMWLPVNSTATPEIYNVAMSTSPNLGFAPGGINKLPILVGLNTKNTTAVKTYVYNAKKKWVACISATAGKSGDYSFTWDGKATKGNTAGLKAGSMVPVSGKGEKYSVKIYAKSSGGSQWSPAQTVKLYTNPKITDVKYSAKTVKSGNGVKISYKTDHFSNIRVTILNAKGKAVAQYIKYLCFPNKTLSVIWDGKVAAGKYTVQITAGRTIYKGGTITVK